VTTSPTNENPEGRRAEATNDVAKRVLDLLLVAVAAPLVLPLGAIVALLIRLEIGRPVLFRQIRPGLNGELFELLKFRTMTDGRDAAGQLLDDARRLTRLGRFLRATSLDELPELWNVVRNEMSLVGPRPLLPEYLPLYSSEQARRHAVLPGITGWAQVNGRNALSWQQRFELDLWYVDNRTLWLDLKIIAKTIMSVIRREGISHPGEATMKRFSGGD